MIPQQLLGEVKEFEGRRGLRGTVVRAEDEMVYVVFADYPIRSARYNRDRTSVMITNTVHYPKTPFDMFFTPCDTLLKGDGRPEGAFTVAHMGKEWLQWSIHPYADCGWDPARDDLASFMEYVDRRFENGD